MWSGCYVPVERPELVIPGVGVASLYVTQLPTIKMPKVRIKLRRHGICESAVQALASTAGEKYSLS